jgi:hypothetical protein
MEGDDESKTKNAESDEAAAAEVNSSPLTFAEFLTNTPPSELKVALEVYHLQRSGGGQYRQINTPELRLHCPECDGVRFFRFSDGEIALYGDKIRTSTFLNYRCSNCQSAEKMYSVHVDVTEDPGNFGSGRCYKFGEYPPYGDPTPQRLLRLFGKDSRLFLKGRQCENHALGIGAFGYYRRLVESHKDQIFDELIKVALKIAPDLVERFKEAKKEQQFLSAIEATKDAMPQALLIDGHNPLTLLHRALSTGLHAKTDEECLELAHHVRVVLADLAERIGQALKGDAELKAAISRIMNRNS